jgi:hypothetical protein
MLLLTYPQRTADLKASASTTSHLGTQGASPQWGVHLSTFSALADGHLCSKKHASDLLAFPAAPLEQHNTGSRNCCFGNHDREEDSL